MSCSQLQTTWSSFAQDHASCTTDADCTTFLAKDPTLSACDNPPGLNIALNKQFVRDAQQYADRYFKLACGGPPGTLPNIRNGYWNNFGWDGLALTNPRCLSGSCTADSLGCNTPRLIDGGTMATSDAGPACPLITPPTCQPPCAPDWTTARSMFRSCDPGTLGTVSFLARCGLYNAVVSRVADVEAIYLYDDTGKLVGHEGFGFFGSSCESYDPAFVPFSACAALGGTCPSDAGTTGDARP
jgi:hypothetical protein